MALETSRDPDLNFERRSLQGVWSRRHYDTVQMGHMDVRRLTWVTYLKVFAPLVFLIDLIDDNARAAIRWLTDLAQVADDKALQITEQ